MKNKGINNETNLGTLNLIEEIQDVDMRKAVKAAQDLIEKQGYISSKYPDFLNRSAIRLSREALQTDPNIRPKDLLLKVISQLLDKLPMKLISDIANPIREEWELFQIGKEKQPKKIDLENSGQLKKENSDNESPLQDEIKEVFEKFKNGEIYSSKYPDALQRNVHRMSREALQNDPDILPKDLLVKILSELPDKLPMKLLADSTNQIKEEWESFQVAKEKAA